MVSNSLYQDLVEDFKKQNQLIDEQINVFEPITASLRKPAAQRLLNTGSLILFELIFYVFGIASFAFAIMMKHVVPFYILETLKVKTVETGFSKTDVDALFWLVTGLFVLSGFLFFYVARLLHKIRLKNAIIHTVNKQIKVLLSQHLQRKAAIDNIEKKHFTELPTLEQGSTDVNDVPNPGY